MAKPEIIKVTQPKTHSEKLNSTPSMSIIYTGKDILLNQLKTYLNGY